MRENILYKLTAAFSVAACLILAPIAHADASLSVGIRPANPDPKNTRSESIFIYTLDKGQAKSDEILMVNGTSTTQTVKLYTVDGMVTNTGAYTCRQASDPKNDLGAWVELSQSEVTLESNKSIKIPFTLTLPESADVGEHNACFVVEKAGDAGTTTGGIKLTTRQAIRIAVTVPGDLKRNLDIVNVSATGANTGKALTMSIKNSGNVSTDVDSYVYVKPLIGGIIFQNGGQYPVLANKQLDLSFPYEKTPLMGGFYHIYGEIKYNKVPGTFGTTDAANLVTKKSAVRTIFIAPQPIGTLLWIVIFGVIVAAVWWTMRRRAHTKEVSSSWQETTVENDTHIEVLAEKYGIGWKRLATVNKISAPYMVKAGRTIKVPAGVNAKKKATTKAPTDAQVPARRKAKKTLD